MTDSILCAINIDQIGTVIEPVHEADTNFVIILGEQTLRKENRGIIDMCNRYYNIGLDIDHTFYGSKNFTELFYQLSDQIVFHRAGIPALVFTSGFHRHTYKTTDDPDIISYPPHSNALGAIFIIFSAVGGSVNLTAKASYHFYESAIIHPEILHLSAIN